MSARGSGGFKGLSRDEVSWKEALELLDPCPFPHAHRSIAPTRTGRDPSSGVFGITHLTIDAFGACTMLVCKDSCGMLSSAACCAPLKRSAELLDD